MDNNNNSSNNNMGNTERLTTPNPGTASNPGENPYSFDTTRTGVNQTEQAGTYPNPGTYDAAGNGTTNMSGTYYPQDTGMGANTYTANSTGPAAGGSGMDVYAEEVYAKKAKSGMIMGIVSLVLNLIFCCIPFLTDWVFSPGYLFIIWEIAGIQNSVQGRKSMEKKGMATAGLVMNIVSLVGSILLIILVMVLKFGDILD